MQDLLQRIEDFRPTDNDFTKLEILLEELKNTETPEKGMVTLFKVLERFHTKSESKVFWNIMDVLEGMKDYKYEFVNSLKRKEGNITMMHLNLLYNDGITYVANEKMEDLLTFIKENPATRKQTVTYINDNFYD